MNTQHTPGPWKIQKSDSFGTIKLSNPNVFILAHGTVAIVMTKNYGTTEAEANAKLIAAAPQLLKALEGIAKMDDKNFANSFHTKEETAKQIMFIGQLAKKAIKAATE